MIQDIKIENHNVQGNVIPLYKVYPKQTLNDGQSVRFLQEVLGEDLAKATAQDYRNIREITERLSEPHIPPYEDPRVELVERDKDWVAYAPDFFQDPRNPERLIKCRPGQLYTAIVIPKAFFEFDPNSSSQDRVKAYPSHLNSERYGFWKQVLDFFLLSSPTQTFVRFTQGWSERINSALAVNNLRSKETGKNISLLNIHAPAVAWAGERLDLLRQTLETHLGIEDLVRKKESLTSLPKAEQDTPGKKIELRDICRELRNKFEAINLIIAGDFNPLFDIFFEPSRLDKLLKEHNISSPFIHNDGTYGWGARKKVDLIGVSGNYNNIRMVPGSYKVDEGTEGFHNSDHKRIHAKVSIGTPTAKNTTPQRKEEDVANFLIEQNQKKGTHQPNKTHKKGLLVAKQPFDVGIDLTEFYPKCGKTKHSDPEADLVSG